MAQCSGRRQTHLLKDHGHEVINPASMTSTSTLLWRPHKLNLTAPASSRRGSSRGGAVAMNINGGDAKLVLLCPAWKNGNGQDGQARPVILHSKADEVIPFADSEELVKNSGLRSTR